MPKSIKELSKSEMLFASGHRACAGCVAPVIIKQVLMVTGKDVVVGFSTGCMEVVSTIYPFTAWKVPFIHNAFENVCATISGAETAYRSLKSQGKVDKDIKFVAFGGDGGMYDIGLQSLSGALERGHKMLTICYDNGAYMNTGIQRSGSTPKYAATSTTPVGEEILGKQEFRKDLTQVVIGHGIPYVAQASPHNWRDFTGKVEKAIGIDGPSFINVISPCDLGWKFNTNEGINLARIAVDTCFWPLYEVENGNYKLTYKPKEKKPIEEFLKEQGRFKHLFKEENKHLIQEIQEEIDKRWNDILKKCE